MSSRNLLKVSLSELTVRPGTENDYCSPFTLRQSGGSAAARQMLGDNRSSPAWTPSQPQCRHRTWAAAPLSLQRFTPAFSHSSLFWTTFNCKLTTWLSQLSSPKSVFASLCVYVYMCVLRDMPRKKNDQSKKSV